MSGHDDHDHDYDHDHDDQSTRTERRGLLSRLRRGSSHAHSHDTPLADTGAAGVRAAKVSLVGLGTTAALQAVLVVFTGSVALLSDTLHNLTDALTAVPLWIAFALGRRSSTQKYIFGWHRAEDPP